MAGMWGSEIEKSYEKKCGRSPTDGRWKRAFLTLLEQFAHIEVLRYINSSAFNICTWHQAIQICKFLQTKAAITLTKIVLIIMMILPMQVSANQKLRTTICPSMQTQWANHLLHFLLLNFKFATYVWTLFVTICSLLVAIMLETLISRQFQT